MSRRPRRRRPGHDPGHPFCNPAEFLDGLTRVARDCVQSHEELDDVVDTDDFDHIPAHLIERRRRRRPRPMRGPPPRPVPRPSTRSSLIGELRARVAATRRLDPAFAWPHETLGATLELERHVALALVLVRVFEPDRLGVERSQTDLDPELLGELASRVMRVRRSARARIEAALRDGGELVGAGLLRKTDADSDFCGPTPFRLPRALRRFVDGAATPLSETRLLQPGRVEPGRWMSERSRTQILARVRGRARVRRLATSPNLPVGSMRRGLGPVRVLTPEGMDHAGLAEALSSLLERPVINCLPGQGAPGLSRSELIAEARVHRAVLVVEEESDDPFAPPFILEEGPGDGLRWPVELDVISLAPVGPDARGLTLEPPNAAVRGELWRAALDAAGFDGLDDDQARRLGEVALHPGQIIEAVATHALEGAEEGVSGLLRAAARQGQGTGDAAGPPELRAADVVLPPRLRAEAEDAIAACRDWQRIAKQLAGTAHAGYGRTPVLLFSGPPGTGKTRLAEALAGELGRPLRRLSGPELRSCWYGESEKRVRAEFRREGDAVLFLDEVDGLLKQRGAGPSAQHDDRLANMLLEELERTTHVVVMATNRADALDAALARRVLFHLRFEEAGPAEREAIWRLHLPAEVLGADGVDCGQLARHPLSGGGIKNASWRAILRATREAMPLTTAVVEEEAVREASRGERRRPSVGFSRRGAERCRVH